MLSMEQAAIDLVRAGADLVRENPWESLALALIYAALVWIARRLGGTYGPPPTD